MSSKTVVIINISFKKKWKDSKGKSEIEKEYTENCMNGKDEKLNETKSISTFHFGNKIQTK